MQSSLIGITTCGADDPIHKELLTFEYYAARGVEKAGGLPVFIPHGLSDESVAGFAARLDGILLTGGGDLDGARYGATHARIGGVDANRDRVELTLMQHAVASEQPIFGICRGAQVMNVAMGGTLHPHLGEVTDKRHDWYPNIPEDYLAHPIRIEEESRLARVIGKPIINVNSLHHQASKDLGQGMRAVAFSPDGIIEAVEHETHPFALGVQWHPEALPKLEDSQALFFALVQACGARRVSRSI